MEAKGYSVEKTNDTVCGTLGCWLNLRLIQQQCLTVLLPIVTNKHVKMLQLCFMPFTGFFSIAMAAESHGYFELSAILK